MALRTSKDLTNETVKLIGKFKSGKLTPIPTGIAHLDETLLGGLLPGTVLGIVARSQHGKTYDSERIARHILNEFEDEVIYVNCNWEMSHFKLLVRDISQRTGDSYKSVLFNPLDEDTKDTFGEICDLHRTENVFYQNEPVDADTFAVDVLDIIKRFPDKKIVVAIDNLENILRISGSQKESMDALLYKVNMLKNKHFFISFIILNQMNQNYILRMDDNRKQVPNDGDIYGSDQLLKLCDVLYVKMIPWKLGIKEKFLLFPKNHYDWLQEHQLHSITKTASFDPFGKAFYFYLKQRQPEDDMNVKDLFIETMFTREESGYKELEEVTLTGNVIVKGNNKDELDFKD